MLCEQFLQIRKIDIKGIWPERAHFQKLIDILDQSDLAELALIVEGEPVISGKNEQHARVRRRFLFVFEVTQRAGHAEMQAQPNIGIGFHTINSEQSHEQCATSCWISTHPPVFKTGY